jgi:predicted dehydrogenase
LIHDFDLLRWLTGKEISAAEGYMAKHILPEHPDFYDTASLQVLMEGHIQGQLYADWHNPRKSWTWGDCRIFVTGTEGMIELRLEGDPLVSTDELLLKVTNSEELQSLALEEVPVCISQDFLHRLEGKQSLINHNEILLAAEATIEADERAKKLVRTKV